MDLTDLIARVEKLEGPDRAVSNAVCIATGVAWAETLNERGFVGDYMRGWYPDVTSSLDAALALVERVLPGWLPSVEKRRGLGSPVTGARAIDIAGRPGWEVWTARLLLTAGERQDANAPTPALALILALLRALADAGASPSPRQVLEQPREDQ